MWNNSQTTLTKSVTYYIYINILDLVITNDKKLVGEIKYEAPLGKSDHCLPVGFISDSK